MALLGLGEQLAGELEDAVFFFVDVVKDLVRQRVGELVEVVAGRVDSPQLLD